MATTLRVRTKVQPGGRIELESLDLPVGQDVDVTITPTAAPKEQRSILEIIESSPPQQIFKTAQEVDEYLRQERDSWDR
jgi:hypothetical protein